MKMWKSSVLAAACGVAMGLSVGAARGQSAPTSVYNAFSAANNSIVAPVGGARVFTSFNGLHRSPNGQRWILVANTDGATTSNRLVIAGTGTTGVLVSQKGEAVPGVAGRTVNLAEEVAINDAGQFAFSSNTLGTGNPSLPFYFGTLSPTPSYSVVAGGGLAFPGPGGGTYSGGYHATLLDNTGRYGFQTDLNDGVTNAALFFNNTIVARVNDPATAPTLLNAPFTDTWASFIQRRMFVDATGTKFLVEGTGSAVGDLVTLNNVAVVQEGQPIPNSALTAPVESVWTCWMDAGGRWFVRLILNDNATAAARTDVVVSNGAVVAKRGDPVIPGSTMLWDRTTAASTSTGFLFHVGNDTGDYVIAGWTLEGTARRPVAVLNGATIVAMGNISGGGGGGTAVDVNGLNGTSDDNATIASFKSEIGPGTAFLTNSGELWMNLNVTHPGGTNEAIVKMQLDLGDDCAADFDGNGAVEISDIFVYLNAWFAGCDGTMSGAPCNGADADFDGNGSVEISDIFVYLNAWFSGC